MTQKHRNMSVCSETISLDGLHDHNLSNSLKVVLVGEAGVGKTNILARYLTGSFYRQHVATIGADFGVKHLDIGDHRMILTIWDTAGQERFHSMTSTLYLRGAQGVAFVYDTTSRKSFMEVEKWIRLVDESEKGLYLNLSYVLVGNKTDKKTDRLVTIEEGRELADRHGMLFLETSAKTGENVEHAFRILAAEIHRRKIENEKRHVEMDNYFHQPDMGTEHHTHHCC